MALAPQKAESLLRLPEVLERFQIGRSTWYAGVKRGIYPPPVKIGYRTAVWRSSDIDRLIASLSA